VDFWNCDIIAFATRHLKIGLEGYPFLELALRCSEGLPLPEGKVKTFVEVPSDGFAVREVEMTWPEYFALCSVHQKLYVPGKKPQTVILRAGRRSGKSTCAAIKALYYGTRKEFRKYVRSNEVFMIPILATSEDQAQRIITERCHEVIKAAGAEWMIGPLDPEIHLAVVTDEAVPLCCGSQITAYPCNSKKVRGEAAPLVVLDEYAQFLTDGKKTDRDIRRAATGAQGQFPGYQEMLTSTPLAEQGDFYESEQNAVGDPSTLCLAAPSWAAAPQLYRNNPEYYHKQFRDDPEGFNREFRAQYAKSASPAFDADALEACATLAGDVPHDATCRYGAALDQSGLAGADRFCLSIAGYDGARDMVTTVCHRTWNLTEKDLDYAMGETRDLLRRYGLYKIATDRYAKGWVHAALAKVGVEALIAPSIVELCKEYNLLLLAKKAALPFSGTLVDGLKKTQLIVSKANNPSIQHPRTSQGHGDDADACVRAVHEAVAGNYSTNPNDPWHAEADRQQAETEERYDPLAIPN
jgi:hypothetical protein